MDGQEVSRVALTKMCSSKVLVIEATLVFHGIQHVDEWVMGLFNLSSTHWRKLKIVVLKDV